MQGFLALIYARNGDADHAIQLIERLLTGPFAVDYADDSITLSDLRQRWEWDSLRNDPRFQKILAYARTEDACASDEGAEVDRKLLSRKCP